MENPKGLVMQGSSVIKKKKNDIAKTRYLNSELREESDDNTLKKTNVMINLKKKLL